MKNLLEFDTKRKGLPSVSQNEKSWNKGVKVSENDACVVEGDEMGERKRRRDLGIRKWWWCVWGVVLEEECVGWWMRYGGVWRNMIVNEGFHDQVLVVLRRLRLAIWTLNRFTSLDIWTKRLCVRTSETCWRASTITEDRRRIPKKMTRTVKMMVSEATECK